MRKSRGPVPISTVKVSLLLRARGLAPLVFVCYACLPGGVVALDPTRAEVESFMADMVREHGFEAGELRKLFDQVETRPKIIEAISRPAERVKPWHEYRDIFLTDKRIHAGADFWREQSADIVAAACESGVPAQVLVAVLGVETFYGRITGGYRVIDALSTLAFDYPPRAEFFRRELEEFLLLTREEQVDPFTVAGSYAGAMGPPQFMPSSYREYAVDASDDGRRDLFDDWRDVLGSVGNYLAVHGWRAGEPVAARVRAPDAMRIDPAENRLALGDTVSGLRAKGLQFDTELPGDAPAMLIALEGAAGPEYWVGFNNFYVITRYNRSAMYALAVHQLGEEIARRKDPAHG
ncbi:MAG TPA: lytic murein transglycosylase B [Gammaproteobacteria bacterium]|nr:lytic murein transglycosylase B [Gammaproteobacteria bacterium]